MGTVVTNNTLHKDVTLLRQLLTYAIEEGQLAALPIIPTPGKIVANPRPWLSRDEWTHLADLAITRMVAATGNGKLHRQLED